MKRSGPPKRKTPLAQESRRREAQRGERKQASDDTIAAGVCVLRGAGERLGMGPCGGRLVAHEMVKQGQLRDARLIEANRLCVCWLHNGKVEHEPKLAVNLGLSIKRWAWDRHGEAVFLEAARLRAFHILGVRIGEPTPSWL